MRSGDSRTLTIDGNSVNATYLGKGRHATAYRFGDTVYLYVAEDEYMKDVIADGLWDTDSPHIPKIAKHGDVMIRGQWRKVYSMPFSRTIKASDGEAWKGLRTLASVAEKIFRERFAGKLHIEGAYYNRDIIEASTGLVAASVTDALDKLADAAANYGSGVSFEFGKRNIGVDADGRIVFRDILFDAEKMRRELAATMKRRRGW